MNILSPKVVPVAIVLRDCHPGANGSEDAITPVARTNYSHAPFVEQQREPEQALSYLLCLRGGGDAAGG